MIVELNHHEVHVIVSALYVAMEQYEKDAEEMYRHSLTRPAEQFERQVHEARKLIEDLEEKT